MRTLNRHPLALLTLGVVLVFCSQLRFGIGLLAWVALVPWLRLLRLRPGPRWSLAVVTASMLAWTLATAKICTDPIPLAMAPAYGISIGLFQGLPLVGYAALRRRMNGAAATALFPAAMVVSEWAQHALTPLGSWGAAAYTQLDLLWLMQLAAVFGIAGPSFLVYLVNAAVDERLAGRGSTARFSAGLVAVVALGGQLRLTVQGDVAEPLVTVAAVGTDSAFGGLPLPTDEELAVIEAGLERRTRAAVSAGAELVVWTEAATLALPEHEAGWRERWQSLVDELEATLVAGVIVPVSTDPLLFENKAVTFSPRRPEQSWLKHRPVPGEPAVPGVGAPHTSLVSGVSMSSAICYDADFPRLLMNHAGAGIALLALPSSDWRGIDPLHTQMAALRGIEGGYSVLRATRFGLSAGFDPYGRSLGQESALDGGDGVLLVDLPRSGRKTPFSIIGDLLVFLCGLGVLLALGLAARRRIDSGAWPAPSSPSPVAPS